MSAIALVAAQDAFTRTLSAVEDAVKFAFRRRLRPQDYEEVMAEARAAAWSAWHGLVKKGKDPVAVGVHGIATNAIRNVRQGRRVGHQGGGRGAMDIYSGKARAKCGFTLVSLDSGDDAGDEDSARGPWREWLAEDNRVTPADEAAFRVDFEAWLEGLPSMKRRIAELLAAGHGGVVVARLVGLSPGRVCQVRRELETAWRESQGQDPIEPEPTTPAREDATRRRGRPRLGARRAVDAATGRTP
jgi:DNA-directed RNA polymerase specialized sigma24 family protein